MLNSLVQTGLANAAIAIPLVVLALFVGKKNKHPHLSHLLWLLVLIKLITPSLYQFTLPAPPSPVLNTLPLDLSTTISTPLSLEAPAKDPESSWFTPQTILIGLWLTGTILLLIFTLAKALLFHRRLLSSCQPAPPEVQNKARQLASALKLRKLPVIHINSASLTPLVWWLGGRIHLVLPKTILQKMPSREWQWGLAHELAHIKRRDHLVRWIEWAAGLAFWWNPLMWLARNQLRAAEEICTDALVLNTFQTPARTYARSILNTLETLASPALRPPAMASEMNSGGTLEKRMKHILNQAPSRKPRILHVCVLLASSAFLPLGIARADEEKPAKKSNPEQAGKEREKEAFRKIREAVAAGDLTKEEAAKKVETLKKRAQRDHDLLAKYTEAEAKMKAAVEAGKMTPEQARERLAHLAKRLKAASKNKPANDGLRATVQRIEEARKAGKITDEEARQKLQALKRRAAAQNENKNENARKHHARLAAEIEAALKAGKITKEEARKKHEAIRRQAAESGKANDQRMRRQKYAEVEAKLKKAIEAGEITKEAAKKRLMQFKKRLWPDNAE